MKFTECHIFSVVFFVICSASVLVIVNGQPTTDDAINTDEIAQLREELAKAIARIHKLEADARKEAQRNSRGEVQFGTSYIRWGRKTCEPNSSLVYTGHAAGPHFDSGGSGSNFLCLPENPQWKNHIDGYQYNGRIYGIEYELWNSGSIRNNIFSEINNGGNPLYDNPAPCAVCYVGDRSTILMIPARTQCPDGWSTEYAGYLVSEQHSNRKRSSYICWDEEPEVAVGGTAQNQAVVYPVEVSCGSLPCSVYLDGRELTCIVCSK